MSSSPSPHQGGNTRRATSRTRTNDENAIPSQPMWTKSSMSHLGPAQKTVAPVKKQTVAVKAGAKRTALGGVVANGQKEEFEDVKKPCESSVALDDHRLTDR